MLESTGEFKCFLSDSPMNNFRAETICSYSRGFCLCGENGRIYIYERNDDNRVPYRRAGMIESQVDQNSPMGSVPNTITSAVITSTEDNMFFITDNNQLMRVNVPLDGTDEESKFEHVIFSFHSASITGLDTCIRKQLLVTCSRDKTVRIWNYASRTLEITHTVAEEASSVAFHPSGFHIVLGLFDKILMMNVLSKSLQQFKTFQIKQCREIRFSNGGHLFAAVN